MAKKICELLRPILTAAFPGKDISRLLQQLDKYLSRMPLYASGTSSSPPRNITGGVFECVHKVEGEMWLQALAVLPLIIGCNEYVISDAALRELYTTAAGLCNRIHRTWWLRLIPLEDGEQMERAVFQLLDIMRTAFVDVGAGSFSDKKTHDWIHKRLAAALLCNGRCQTTEKDEARNSWEVHAEANNTNKQESRGGQMLALQNTRRIAQAWEASETPAAAARTAAAAAATAVGGLTEAQRAALPAVGARVLLHKNSRFSNGIRTELRYRPELTLRRVTMDVEAAARADGVGRFTRANKPLRVSLRAGVAFAAEVPLVNGRTEAARHVARWATTRRIEGVDKVSAASDVRLRSGKVAKVLGVFSVESRHVYLLVEPYDNEHAAGYALSAEREAFELHNGLSRRMKRSSIPQIVNVDDLVCCVCVQPDLAAAIAAWHTKYVSRKKPTLGTLLGTTHRPAYSMLNPRRFYVLDCWRPLPPYVPLQQPAGVAMAGDRGAVGGAAVAVGGVAAVAVAAAAAAAGGAR